MGYSTRSEIEQALANALTNGNPEGTGPINITEIGNTLSATVTDDQIAQYGRWADEQIDADLSTIYRVPLKRVNKGTFRLALDATVGDTMLTMEDASRFTAGDTIVIRQGVLEEEGLVVPQPECVPEVSPAPPPNFAQPPDSRKLCLWLPITNSYDLNLARIDRIRFPDPIPKISARIAAAFIYDRHFAAQVEGNQSDFGKALRAEAKQQLNLILTGVTKLLIADANEFVGRRYYNQALDDAPGTSAEAGKTFLSES
jgi:hypothetical protein